jgi:hypothetical protein
MAGLMTRLLRRASAAHCHLFCLPLCSLLLPPISLWTSRLDGSDMREIGQQDAPRVDGWNTSLYDLSWTPDGKRLSFVCDGALWTLPAD